MKRLLSIGSSMFLFSILPIAGWFVLGITLNQPEISNVFSLTYPLQFITYILVSLFSTGANITSAKDKNNNAVLTGIVVGFFADLIIFGTVAILIEPYINYMYMDVATYKVFGLYSVGQIFVSVLFSFALEKLNFEGKEKLGTIYSIIYNVLNFGVLIITSLITKNQVIIASVTFGTIAVFAIGLLFSQFKKFKFDLKSLKSNFKYESVNIIGNAFSFATFLFGFSNAFSAGEEYIKAINFEALVTDAQWDTYTAISTVAKIDIANDEYNHKRHLKEGLLFTSILVLSSLAMFEALYRFFRIDLAIVLILFAFEILDFYLCTIVEGFSCYLQIKHSPTENTLISLSGKIVRLTLASLLPTAFCNAIGQMAATVLVVGIYLILRFKYYQVDIDGALVRKHIEQLKKIKKQK